MNATSCSNCAAPLPAGSRFCGQCGAPVDGVSVPAGALTASAAPPAGPSVLRRYRGPLWLTGTGTVLFLAGAGVVTAIFSAVQVEAAPGILVDIFSPVLQDQVDGTIAEGVVDLAGDGGTDAETLGWYALGGLVGGALAAAFGLLLMLIGGAWGANRAMTKRRSGSVTIATPPTPVQLPPPSFHTAPPPTFSTMPPPELPPPPPPPSFSKPG